MKLKFTFLLIILSTIILYSQNMDLANHLYYNYEQFKENSLTKRRIKHSDIVPLIENLRKDSLLFEIKIAGKSAQGRDIYLIKTGKGNKKIFMWSQMHGDEPTATMALFDIFNFLKSEDLKELKEKLLNEVTIYFMPMVNPDGAELYQRRNIYDIDINRDAIRTSTPEGFLLKSVYDSIKADFGFNLHDQSTRYTAGKSHLPATISFLAPAPDYEKTVTPARENAIKLIGSVYSVINNYIPGHIAKYNDDFEPRAFGDNFQKWGMSTILVESGGWSNDIEKQFIRKINFILLLQSIKDIAEENYKNFDESVYNSIPFNESLLKDLLLRNLTLTENNRTFVADISINRSEINYNNYSDFFLSGSIDDIGDLSVFYGYEDFDLTGFTAEPGKTFPMDFYDTEEIEQLDFHSLYAQGFTKVRLVVPNYPSRFSNFPVNIIIPLGATEDRDDIAIGEIADLVIKKGNEVFYVVINGFIYDLKNRTGEIHNGLVRTR